MGLKPTWEMRSLTEMPLLTELSVPFYTRQYAIIAHALKPMLRSEKAIDTLMRNDLYCTKDLRGACV